MKWLRQFLKYPDAELTEEETRQIIQAESLNYTGSGSIALALCIASLQKKMGFFEDPTPRSTPTDTGIPAEPTTQSEK